MRANHEHDKVKDNELFAQDKVEMMTAHFDAISVYIFRKEKGALGPKDNGGALLDLMCKMYCLESI